MMYHQTMKLSIIFYTKFYYTLIFYNGYNCEQTFIEPELHRRSFEVKKKIEFIN